MKMDIEQAKANTQWVPFDKERMSEAVEYRFDSELTITNLSTLDCVDIAGRSIVAINSGGHLCSYRTNEIEMLVPQQPIGRALI